MGDEVVRGKALEAPARRLLFEELGDGWAKPQVDGWPVLGRRPEAGVHWPALASFLLRTALAADLLPTPVAMVGEAILGGLEHRPPDFPRSGRARCPGRKGAACLARFRQH